MSMPNFFHAVESVVNCHHLPHAKITIVACVLKCHRDSFGDNLDSIGNRYQSEKSAPRDTVNPYLDMANEAPQNAISIDINN
jgi:hypothetical protein